MLESRTLSFNFYFYVCCRLAHIVVIAWRTFIASFLLRTTLLRIFVVFLPSSLVMYICEWRTPPLLLSLSFILWGQNLTHIYFVRASPNSPVIDLSGRVRETALTSWGSIGSERVSAATGRVLSPALFCFLPSISNFMPFQLTTIFNKTKKLIGKIIMLASNPYFSLANQPQ